LTSALGGSILADEQGPPCWEGQHSVLRPGDMEDGGGRFTSKV